MVTLQQQPGHLIAIFTSQQQLQQREQQQTTKCLTQSLTRAGAHRIRLVPCALVVLPSVGTRLFSHHGVCCCLWCVLSLFLALLGHLVPMVAVSGAHSLSIQVKPSTTFSGRWDESMWPWCDALLWRWSFVPLWAAKTARDVEFQRSHNLESSSTKSWKPQAVCRDYHRQLGKVVEWAAGSGCHRPS